MVSTHSFILVVVGLAFEARIARTRKSANVCCRRGSQAEAAMERALNDPRCRGAISFGIAGGLDPELSAGDVVVASGIASGGRRWPAHPALSDQLAATLLAGGIRTRRADIAGVDAPLLTAGDKASVRFATGAAAVDMESHVACEFAARHGLVFAAIRIICDPAARSMPAMVANALKPDGGLDTLAVLADLLKKPTQLAALPRLANEARTSFRALGRCRDLLGIGRGFPDLVELLGDVA